MKKAILIAIVLVSFMAAETNAQLNLIKKNVDDVVQSLASKCNVKIESQTVDLSFFKTMTAVGLFIVAKGEGNYFIIMKYTGLPKNNGLTGSVSLILKNGDTININECGKAIEYVGVVEYDSYYLDYSKNTPKISTIKNHTFIPNWSCYLYKSSLNDLKKIAENAINEIIIYYSPLLSKKDNNDDNSKLKYFEYNVGFKKKYYKMAAQNIITN